MRARLQPDPAAWIFSIPTPASTGPFCRYGSSSDLLGIVRKMGDTSVAGVNRHYFNVDEDTLRKIIEGWRPPKAPTFTGRPLGNPSRGRMEARPAR
jgi:hypothetical protein